MICHHCHSATVEIGDCCTRCREILRISDPIERREALKESVGARTSPVSTSEVDIEPYGGSEPCAKLVGKSL